MCWYTCIGARVLESTDTCLTCEPLQLMQVQNVFSPAAQGENEALLLRVVGGADQSSKLGGEATTFYLSKMQFHLSNSLLQFIEMLFNTEI